MPYYFRFLETFPTVQALANATEHEVLRLWQGLGYYTRARNLHKCAKVVVSKYNGQFPNNFKSLLQLPGIGEYTAAAIASFSFKEPVAVVDGNVFRVLSRVFGIENEINSPEGKKIFTSLANSLINKKFPDFHNQAVMEFGALHCVPKNPPCLTCTFQSACFAAQRNLQSLLPRKAKSKPSRKRYFYYFVVQRGKSLLMKKRDGKDIWHGLYDFHLVGKKTGRSRSRNYWKRLPPVQKVSLLSISWKFQAATNIFSHIKSFLQSLCLIKSGKFKLPKEQNLKFYTFEKIYDLPKPVLITRFLSDYKNFYS